MKPWVAVAMMVGAFAATACASARSRTVQAANALARSAELGEELLTSICRSAELKAIDESASDEEAARKIVLIEARCASAWEAYTRFRSDWLELAVAIQGGRAARDGSEPTALLARVEADERRFIELVNEIAKAFVGGGS